MNRIIVFDFDNAGIIADVASILEEKQLNIESMLGFTIKGFGLVFLSVDRHDEAVFALKEKGISAVTDKVLLLLLEDRPGALAEIAMRFKDENISLDAIRILKRRKGDPYALVGITTSEQERAKLLVQDVAVESQITW